MPLNVITNAGQSMQEEETMKNFLETEQECNFFSMFMNLGLAVSFICINVSLINGEMQKAGFFIFMGAVYSVSLGYTKMRLRKILEEG